jgi:hypothetical protein
MSKAFHFTLIITTVSCIALFTQGCKPAAPPAEKESAPQAQAPADAHAALHQTKYNQTLVEFPGHKYSMEIIDDEATGLVTAFLTDAHFAPIDVDAKEVRLNFTVDGAPKTFTLTRLEQETGKPATFTLTDKALATLNCDGWQGEATASVEISGTPYNAKLTKLGAHDHDHAQEGHNHEGHGHAH